VAELCYFGLRREAGRHLERCPDLFLDGAAVKGLTWTPPGCIIKKKGGSGVTLAGSHRVGPCRPAASLYKMFRKLSDRFNGLWNRQIPGYPGIAPHRYRYRRPPGTDHGCHPETADLDARRTALTQLPAAFPGR